jgi:hypothetical protein
LVGLAPPIYSDLGADIVYGIISLIDPFSVTFRLFWSILSANLLHSLEGSVPHNERIGPFPFDFDRGTIPRLLFLGTANGTRTDVARFQELGHFFMHCYLYITCANRACQTRVLLSHQSAPNFTVVITYPDKWFPVEVRCPRCGLTELYSESEIEHQSSEIPVHPSDWKPVLSSPKPKMRAAMQS